MIRWGVLGTGRVTQRMIQAIQSTNGNTIAAIASRDIDRSLQWAKQPALVPLSPIHPFGDYYQLIDASDVDWVYVATTPNLHFPLASAALRSGKNVLCEKPLCMNGNEALELAAIANQTGRKLYHATSFPYHPRSIASKELIASGKIGDIKRITIACSFADALRRDNDHRSDAALGGGCLLDLGWYCVSVTKWLTGLEPISLKSYGTKTNGVWSQIQTLVKFNNGAIAHWDCGFDTATRRWVEVAGSEGSWICDDFLRPWDLAKPRFWVHGHAGKTDAATVGENFFQESEMIRQCEQGSALFHMEQLRLALHTHSILDAIELAANSGNEILDFSTEHIPQCN